MAVIRAMRAAVLLTAVFAGTVACGAEPARSLFYEPAAKTVSIPGGWQSSNGDKILPGENGSEATLSIMGNGESSDWLSSKIPFEPRKLYRLRFRASTAKEGAGDCLCAGPSFANTDYHGVPNGLAPQENYSSVFFAPDAGNEAPVRFAQWNSRREYRASDFFLCAVAPVFKRISAKEDANVFVALGGGEYLDQSGKYRFESFHSGENSNYDRPLFSTTSRYNTGRWTMSAGTQLVYRFALDLYRNGERIGAAPFASGALAAQIGHYATGKAVVEGSVNGSDWVRLGEMSGLASRDFDIAPLLKDGQPSDEIFMRIRCEESEQGKGGSLQIYLVAADLTPVMPEGITLSGAGETIFADLANETEPRGSGIAAVPVLFDDQRLYLETPLGELLSRRWDDIQANGRTLELLEARCPGDRRTAFYAPSGLNRPFTVMRPFWSYYVQDYATGVSGARVVGSADLAWCDADYHVPRNPVKREIGASRRIRLRAAKNDYESFQLILNAKNAPLNGIEADLISAPKNGEAVLPAENVQIRYAYYHFVEDPTDRTCAPGYYPDALVPISQGADGKGAPLCAGKGENFLLWVTVKTPADAAPGRYSGAVRITANDGAFRADVPFDVDVWDFALPEKNMIETAYGCRSGEIWRYHNCTTEADKREVFDSYLQMYGDYRMSIYNPAPLDPIKVKWQPKADPPSCELDFTAFDREMKRVFDKYHFTNFSLWFRGLGGGTFADRYDGEVEGYKAGTPEYESMMADYGRKLQEHLRETGLLKAAYVYCFDEPEEKDYEFVAGQFARLTKFAPDIAKMLTEEPSPGFEKVLKDAGTNVDVWCPISNCYSDEGSKTQRAEGARFWWYVCTGPKAPYCTEFTDHPAQELRIWHWQAFERDIVGSLIWETTYWTSPVLFPENAQNPYLDPMSYMSGYGLPIGTRRPWGNGDGRFVYPPLTAAVPGMNDGKPIKDAPNASIRLEMIRAGVQDYEMLLMLKNILAEKGDAVPEELRNSARKLFDFAPITTDMTHFSDDPQDLLKRRAEVGDMIEKLGKGR